MAIHYFNSNPFPGVRSFETDESHLFFGRETQVNELTKMLEGSRFLAIVGSSGCGKSSLIKAGLIPRLMTVSKCLFQKSSQVIITQPGDDPIANIAKAITGDDLDHVSIDLDIPYSNEGIISLIKKNNADGLQPILVVDQFEELFRLKMHGTHVKSMREVTRFIDLIVHIATQTEILVNVVIAMRTDFLDACTEFREFSEMLNKGSYLVPRMNDDEKEKTITGPVLAAGGSITGELKEMLLNDMAKTPDELTIMQHAMMRTWEHWLVNRIGRQPIGVENYRAVGTMQEAMSKHLEEIFDGLRDNEQKQIAEMLFKALTDITKESRGSRRPTMLVNICVLSGCREEDIIEVIDAFRKPGSAFLLPAAHVKMHSKTIIDIAHRCVFHVWKKLAMWVKEETASAQLYLRLSKSAELYQEGKTGLWVNPDLQLALQWKAQHKPNAVWAARYDPAFERAMHYLDYSSKQHELKVRRKEKQQRRNFRRVRNTAVLLGIASVVSVFFLIISLNLRFKAEASQKEALENEQIALRESRRAEEQRLLAIEQRQIAEQQTHIALQQERISEQEREHAVRQQMIAEQQRMEALEQRHQADLARTEAIQLREEAERQRNEALLQQQIAEQERSRAEESEREARRLQILETAKALAFQANQLHASSDDDVPALLALHAYQLNLENQGYKNNPLIYEALSAISYDPVRWRGHKDAVRVAALTDNGNTLFSLGDDQQILKWDLTNIYKPPENIILPSSSSSAFRSISIFNDDAKIVAGTASGSLLVWDTDDLYPEPLILNEHKANVNAICNGFVDNMFFSAGADGQLLQWVLDDDIYHYRTLDVLETSINSVALSPCGKLLVYATETGLLKMISMDMHEAEPKKIIRFQSPILSIAFNQAGNVLAIGLQNGDINILSPIKETGKIETIRGRHQSGITGLAFNHNDTQLASSSFDWTVKISDFPLTDEQPINIAHHEFWVYGLLFTPDDRYLVSYSADRTILVVSTHNRFMAEQLQQTIARNLTEEEWRRLIGDDITYQKIFDNLP